MSGYVHRLAVLREAVVERFAFESLRPPPAEYRPADDALLRRVAERLPDELVDDVAELIKLARGDR